jgi:adenosylcobinamide kinase / adenosylcobinamide-phosphate guanylyltransferase
MINAKQCILVTGPTRSGKSEWAEQLASQSGLTVVYIATAQVDESDREWQTRIQTHQQRRPSHWQTEHIPVELAIALQAASAETCLLVDSLGTWLANLLDQDEETWSATVQQLLDSIQQTQSTIIFVSEETGWGVVPAYPVGRVFRDRLGSLTRQIGMISTAVYLVSAGYALDLRRLGTPVDDRSSIAHP